jgi:hypothetical protein
VRDMIGDEAEPESNVLFQVTDGGRFCILHGTLDYVETVSTSTIFNAQRLPDVLKSALPYTGECWFARRNTSLTTKGFRCSAIETTAQRGFTRMADFTPEAKRRVKEDRLRPANRLLDGVN